MSPRTTTTTSPYNSEQQQQQQQSKEEEEEEEEDGRVYVVRQGVAGDGLDCTTTTTATTTHQVRNHTHRTRMTWHAEQQLQQQSPNDSAAAAAAATTVHSLLFQQDHSQKTPPWWIQQGGLGVFLWKDWIRACCQSSLSRFEPPPLQRRLAPGAYVTVTDWTMYNTAVTSGIPQKIKRSNNNNNNMTFQPGTLTLAHLSNDCAVVAAVGAYDYLTTTTTQQEQGGVGNTLFRTVATAGCVIRTGLELYSNIVTHVPYGSCVSVQERRINRAGLVRLRVTTTDKVTGWASAHLNPQSGRYGTVLQPIPTPRPQLYRIVRETFVRTGIELASPLCTVLTVGTLVAVTERTFTEVPAAGGVERLRIVHSSRSSGQEEEEEEDVQGWISCRIHAAPPNNHELVESLGRVDETYDPDQWQQYALRRTGATTAMNVDDVMGANITTTTASSSCATAPTTCPSSALPTLTTTAIKTTRLSAATQPRDDTCVVCLTHSRNATFIHGETGHIACCLTCARILFARGDPCPVCRLPLEKVVQQFWA